MIRQEAGNQSREIKSKRKWIGLYFDCCQIYSRIYVNKGNTAYEGRCPRCFRQVSVRIGPEGTKNRFFKAW